MSELVDLQAGLSNPTPEAIAAATDLIIPPQRSADRLRHFPEEVYNLSSESHIVRLLKVLLGDAGAGQLRKRLNMVRLQGALQTTHFYDLDRFYGALFGMVRTSGEKLDLNPYTELATGSFWLDQQVKDSSYKSRIIQFAKGFPYGGTPTGIELVAEAVLAVDCDVYETWYQADEGYQTYGEIETAHNGPNMLTANVAGIETDATGWQPGTNVNIARSTSAFRSGVASLAIAPTALTDGRAYTTTPITVTAGQTYAASAWVRSGALPRYAQIKIVWQTAAGVDLGSTDSPRVLTSLSDWTQVSIGGVAPPTAERVFLFVYTTLDAAGGSAGQNGEVNVVDDIWLSKAGYTTMEGLSYSTLEGLGIARLAGNERRMFVVRPKRPITPSEAHDLSRVLDRIKPADARYTIDFEGVDIHEALPLSGLLADSVHWEVVPHVAPRTLSVTPYLDPQTVAVEQPRPPFSGYQGEAWSYNADVVGVSAYTHAVGQEDYSVMPVQRIVFENGSFRDFAPGDGVLPRRFVQGGRSVSDAILVAHPFAGPRGMTYGSNEGMLPGSIVTADQTSIAKLYADRIPLDALNDTINRLTEIEPFQQNPDDRFWSTPERYMADATEEILEARLTGPRLVNYITYEVPHFPHLSLAQTYDEGAGEWVTLHENSVSDSFPSLMPLGRTTRSHPHHDLPGHWMKVSRKIDPTLITRFRVVLVRQEGEPPRQKGRSAAPGQASTSTELPYSLGLRSLDLGYRVSSRDDIPVMDETLGNSTDLLGSPVQFVAHEELPVNLLDGTGPWRSEPQPVNYAVVNLYVDARDGNGDSQVIDRLYMNPTHPGPHCTIYYSDDPAIPDGTTAFFEARTWTPINRDYILQKGYWHLPSTRAKFFKLEFTNLVAEPYESFVPITRQLRLFPASVVKAMYQRRTESEGSLPPGMLAATEVAAQNYYRDALYVLTGGRPAEGYLPSEALTTFDPLAQEQLRNQDWIFGLQPWHQGDEAPRFTRVGVHTYERAEVLHSHKVAFFVGLSEFKAYRVKYEEDDDTQVYLDPFNDFRNLMPSFTWQFDPGAMTAPTDTASATSRVFASRHNVRALQFATQQSNPVQLIPDDDFRDPILVDYDWTDTDTWHRIGDASLIYSQTDHGVKMVRFTSPPPKVVTADLTPEHGPIKPVFSYRDTTVADEAAAANEFGGIRSALVNPAAEGRIYAAVRLTLDTDLTNPLLLQIIDGNDDTTVLAEMEITGQKGEMIERYVHLDISPSITIVRAQLIQEGKSDDAWQVDTLSIFDEGIVWEFSVNGGVDWMIARGIRNNANGILTFPEPGNQLTYRVRGLRSGVSVSAIQIRPIYQGNQNSRLEGTHRGPNVSTYDHEQPIHEDPMFTSWTKPIPRTWFAAAKRFPILPIEGQVVTNEFSRFYSRTASDTIAAPTDAAVPFKRQGRIQEERLDFFNPLSDAATRQGLPFRRVPTDNVAVSDAAFGIKIEKSTNPIVNRPPHEVI